VAHDPPDPPRLERLDEVGCRIGRLQVYDFPARAGMRSGAGRTPFGRLAGTGVVSGSTRWTRFGLPTFIAFSLDPKADE
jgi:hypothetical protein